MRETVAGLVFAKFSPQVFSVTDVETCVGFRSQHVNVEHKSNVERIFSVAQRLRASRRMPLRCANCNDGVA
jgi:hypothetical protein